MYFKQLQNVIELNLTNRNIAKLVLKWNYNQIYNSSEKFSKKRLPRERVPQVGSQVHGIVYNGRSHVWPYLSGPT